MVMNSKRKNYLKWEDYFMGIADLSAQRSKDPKTQVGCCIVDPRSKHILSIGYNGLPTGFNDDDFDWETSKEDFTTCKNSYVVHAEANAILNAVENLEGADVYVTMFPCNECAKLLSQKKVRRIFYRDDKFLYKDEGKVSQIIFEKAGVELVHYSKKDDGEKNED
jgi:dCMP deaminase